MHHTLSASVPRHLYGYVCREILTGLDPNEAGKYEPCVIIGVTSIPSRALHFEILCESGAKWARIPLHMLRHHLPEDGAPTHPLTDLQSWDCHGWDFATVEFEYLREMACEFRTASGAMVSAAYWFTLDHTDNGFSQYPPEHKNYNLLLLEDGSGQIAAQPNNRILWRDDSFVRRTKPIAEYGYRVMPPVTWHAEVERTNPHDTAMAKD